MVRLLNSNRATAAASGELFDGPESSLVTRLSAIRWLVSGICVQLLNTFSGGTSYGVEPLARCCLLCHRRVRPPQRRTPRLRCWKGTHAPHYSPARNTSTCRESGSTRGHSWPRLHLPRPAMPAYSKWPSSCDLTCTFKQLNCLRWFAASKAQVSATTGDSEI